MKLSTDRILTTHVGSLPRPPDVAELLFAREQATRFDAAAFDLTISKAVQAVVARQVAIGLERVLAGTDCGFGTFAGIGKLDPEISWRKLQFLVDGATRASKRLWS